MENHRGLRTTGEPPDSSTRALWSILSAGSSSSKAGGPSEENDEFLPYEVSLPYFEVLFNMRYSADGFMPLSKGRRAADFIALGWV
jgi:hypothetical protein